MSTKASEAFVGESVAIRAVRDELRYAARSDAKVLLTGESGVGKEVVARLVHAQSPRRLTAFVAINCAGVPDSLLESELFGHVRGSFTGAYRDRAGLLEQADGGTVFMDEVGEMTPRMQGLLLRFLETGEIQPVGSDQPHIRSTARVVAATNRNLLECVAAGEFREDLYYRLNVIHIRIPALRERRDDIPLLLQHFLSAFAAQYELPTPRVTDEALAKLVGFDWPGNVRELRNTVERLMVRRPGPTIGAELLPAVLNAQTANGAGAAPEPPQTTAAALIDQIVRDGQSFWRVVYEPFMARDITRGDLRAVVHHGLERTYGNCKGLVRLFNMPESDYKRFLNFLHKYGCNPRFHARSMSPDQHGASARIA
jgi:DNA-binding NtrC family response regulator